MATYSLGMNAAIQQLIAASGTGNTAANTWPSVPDLLDETVIEKQLMAKRRLAAMQGRGSTFLTGPRGLEGPSSEIAQAFLRAKWQQQDREASPVSIIRIPGAPNNGTDQTPVLTPEERSHMEMPTGKTPQGAASLPGIDSGVKPVFLAGMEMPTGKKLSALSRLYLSGRYSK